jgi:hypothetical protein
MDPLRIGIVLNYKEAEKKKDELMRIDKYDWLKNTEEHFVILRKKKRHIPADVAIGKYIENNYNNVVIDYIVPDEISTRRFKQNDIVFVIIYDLLECFHLSDTTRFNKFKNALKNSNNIYPPYKYQKFINNKCSYYKYLADHDIPVAPTHCVSKDKWFTRNKDQYTQKIIDKVKNNGWKSIIAKPVYGQEAIDFAKFTSCKNNSLQCKKPKLKKYFARTVEHYKDIVIQEYIEGFDKENPEIRAYFINGAYMYSIITTESIVATPIQEGGRFKLSNEKYNYLRYFTQEVMDTLPKLDLPGELANPIVTRIDVGSGLKGVPYEYFINEIEFVPSLYIEDHSEPVVECIGDSLVKVGNIYKSIDQLPIEVHF